MSVIIALGLIWALILQVFVPGFPKETILLLAGSTFGIFWGSLLNWTGMVAGAQLAYEVVRYSVKVGGRMAGVLEEYRQSKLVTYLEQRGNQGLLLFRLIPTAPNDILSMLAGALFLPRKGFFIVSVITAVPYAIFFAYLGEIGAEFLGFEVMWMVNGILALIAVSIAIIKKVTRDGESSASPDYDENVSPPHQLQ